MNDLLHKISLALGRHEDVLSRRGSVISALSGGSDSVALLLALHELGYHTVAAHFNFHLRGEESMRDEHFVRCLCGSLGVELFVREADTSAYAAARGWSVEMAARELRYDFFAELSEKLGGAAVAVAHHQGDNAETLLLNLVRGTGLRGIRGMAEQSVMKRAGGELCILRPMLKCSREEIHQWLGERCQQYVTDSSNLVSRIKRNRIRLCVIPELRKINPALGDTLERDMHKFSEAYKVYEHAMAGYLSRIGRNTFGDEILCRDDFSDCASMECLIHEWLSPKGFAEQQTSEIAEYQGSETREYEIGGYLLLAAAGRCALLRKASLPHSGQMELPREGEAIFPPFRFSVTRLRKMPDISELRDPSCAYLDSAAIDGKIIVRPARWGDRFVPFGMHGSKLVSDFMCDAKVFPEERARQLVVCDDSKILWAVGRRTDNRLRISPQTREIVKIQVKV